MHFWCNLKIFCRYEALWDRPVAMVAYSFGGLVLKSLVVEMHKHVYQKKMNHLDVEAQNCCEKFLKNLKGVVFYSVPHAGGTQDLSKYFKWQCQQIAKDTTPSGLLKNMESFNTEMEQLSIDFNKSIWENINIYAFVEALPIDNEWVRFSSKHIDYPTRFHRLNIFYVIETCVGLTFETTNISCEIGHKFSFLCLSIIATCIHSRNCKFIVNRISIERTTFVVLF